MPGFGSFRSPGASALTAVLSATGLPTDRFVFEGFLPAKKKQRRERLQILRDEIRTLIFYEAPHRLRDALDDIHELLGNREAVLAREVSKIHEEFLRGPISELVRALGRRTYGEKSRSSSAAQQVNPAPMRIF